MNEISDNAMAKPNVEAAIKRLERLQRFANIMLAPRRDGGEREITVSDFKDMAQGVEDALRLLRGAKGQVRV